MNQFMPAEAIALMRSDANFYSGNRAPSLSAMQYNARLESLLRRLEMRAENRTHRLTYPHESGRALRLYRAIIR